MARRIRVKHILQTLLAGLFRGVILLYLGYFNGIVKKCYRRRLAEEKEEEQSTTSEENK